MLPVLYWTNMSGIYDMLRIGNEIYMATFGGIVMTNVYLEQKHAITFANGLPSNIVVALDTFMGNVWFLTLDQGFGYIRGGRIFVYPKAQIPLSDLREGRGMVRYDDKLILFGREWILEVDPQREVVKELFSINMNHVIEPPVGDILVRNDSIYIGDSLGIVATSWNYRDVPASYTRILNTPQVNDLFMFGDTMYIATVQGLYRNGSAILDSVSVLKLQAFRDTLFLSCRQVGSSEPFSSGYVLKMKGSYMDTLYENYAPFGLFVMDSNLYVSALSPFPYLPYKHSRAYGIIVYPDMRVTSYRTIPSNYITNILADDDDIFVFTGREIRNANSPFSFIGFNITRNFNIYPSEMYSYTVRGANWLNDSTVAISTPYALYFVYSSGRLETCYSGTASEDFAFTGATVYRDTLLVVALSGKVYSITECPNLVERSYYEVVGNARHIASNGDLLALGGDGGFAVFLGDELLFLDNTLVVRNVAKYGNGFAISTNDGAYIYDGYIRKLKETSGKAVVSTIEDIHGSLWVLAEDGIYHYNDELRLWGVYRFSGKAIPDLRNWPPKNNLAIFQDTLLLFGTDQGIGIIRIKPTRVDLGSMKLYPNPANDRIFVERVVCNRLRYVDVLTASGVSFKVGYTCDVYRDRLSVDIAQLEGGFYFLRVVFDEGRKLLKFMKR